MIRKTPAELAETLNRLPIWLITGCLASLARALQGSFGNRLPYRVSQKLGQLALRGGKIKIYASVATKAKSAKRVLLVSHDLSLSGAPILLSEIAVILRGKGWHVTLASPSKGALLDRLVEGGVDVLIPPSIGLAKRRTWAQLAKTVDVVICNTVATRKVMASLAPLRPCLWYLHEVSLIEDLLASDKNLCDAFGLPEALWAGSEMSAKVVREYRSDVRVVPYGLQPLANNIERAPGTDRDRPLRIVLLGSYEARKGHDLLLDALKLLSPDMTRQCQVAMFGKVLDSDFHARLCDSAMAIPNLSINGDLNTEQYKQTVLDCDAVIIASRDDTLPLVSLDALGAGRVLMCTSTTGTSAYLQSGLNGFVAKEASAEAIASMLNSAISQRASWPTMGARGANIFKTHFSKHTFETTLAEQLDKMTRSEGAQP